MYCNTSQQGLQCFQQFDISDFIYFSRITSRINRITFSFSTSGNCFLFKKGVNLFKNPDIDAKGADINAKALFSLINNYRNLLKETI